MTTKLAPLDRLTEVVVSTISTSEGCSRETSNNCGGVESTTSANSTTKMNRSSHIFFIFPAIFVITMCRAQDAAKPSIPLESRSLEVNDNGSDNEEPFAAGRRGKEEQLNLTLSTTTPKFDLGSKLAQHPPFWISKRFHIVCCMGGVPVVNHQELAQNFSYHLMSFVIDDQEGNMGQNCRLFKGSYLLPPPKIFNGNNNNDLEYAVQVVCKCPDMGSSHALDSNCRRLPTCMNNGFRSLIDPRRCLCLQPFFGDKCEKFCDQGQRLRGVDGRDYCSCTHLYRGEECRDVVCLNGGREESGRCICPPNVLGFHCEIDANKTLQYGNGLSGHSSRFQRFGDQHSEVFTRDISGTIFSLIMIVVLVVSMYLLMKHRMQMHTRYLSRRPDLLNACNFPIVPPSASSNRRVELFPNGDDLRGLPFRSLGFMNTPIDGGPPPYSTGRQGRHSRRNEVLPPLPSYEDATKLPAFVRQENISQPEEGEEVNREIAGGIVETPNESAQNPTNRDSRSNSSLETQDQLQTRREDDDQANEEEKSLCAQSLQNDASPADDK